MDLSLAPGFRASQSLAQQVQSALNTSGQAQAPQGVTISSVRHGDGRLDERVQIPWNTYCLRSQSPAILPMSDRPMDRTAAYELLKGDIH